MKKYILFLILILAIVLGLTSCGFMDDAFKRKSTPNLFPTETNKNNSNPTTTNSTKNSTEKVEEKYKIIFHENGHGTKPSDLSNVDEIPNQLPTMTASGYNFLGWSLESDSSELVTAGTKISKNTDLYAVWEELGHKLIFHENGHGEKPDDIENVKEIPVVLPELEEEGYDFIGWSKSESSRTVVTPGTRISKDLDLYAIWARGRYTITYVANGHGEAPEAKTNTSKIPNLLPGMVDADYYFIGWSYDMDSSELVTAGEEIFEDVTLYGVWEEKTYTISFVSNGHGDAIDDINNVNKIPNTLPVLEEEGYIFKGWSNSKVSTVLVTPGEKISSNVTLYALWDNETYTVTYHANGHGEDPAREEDLTHIPDLLPELSDDDYDFLGWSLDANSKVLVEAGSEISTDVDLYAVWEHKTYKVTYNTNGHGEKPEDLTNVYKLPETLPVLEDDDYDFLGWSLKDSTALVEPNTEIKKDTELYAVWKEKTYTITYHANGHGTAPLSQTNAKKLPLYLPVMIEVGYEFLGWALSEDSETLVSGGLKINKDTDLYGVWNEIVYTISYDLNGHGTTKPKDTEYVKRYPNPLPEPKADGWKFRGWTESKTSNVIVKPGQEIDENKTLYARWDRETYRVIYQSNGHGVAPHEDAGLIALPNPLPSMTVDGWDFLGWSLYSDSNTLVEAGEEITSNTYLYAVWKEQKFNITFHANGHGTAPDGLVGYTNIPTELPTMVADGYVFKGWSSSNQNNILVDEGRRITENTDLYGIWISRTSMVKEITLKNPNVSNDLFDSNKVDEELKKVVFTVEYTDGVIVDFIGNKNMISQGDYNLLKAGGKESLDITFTVEEQAKVVSLKPWPWWNVSFYARGEMFGPAYDWPDGSNSNGPTGKPSDYLDDDNILWTFDRWDQSYYDIHAHLKINALYKKVDLFDYSVIINKSNELMIEVSQDNRVDSFEIKVIDNQTNAIAATLTNPDTQLNLSNLVSGRVYRVNGTYTYIFEDHKYEVTVSENVITAAVVDNLKKIDYQMDDASISDTSVSVDISPYVEKTPEGYELDKVYLVKVDDQTIASEYEYNGNDQVIFFEGLTASTEYETYFVYQKNHISLTSYKPGRKNAPKLNLTSEYGFAFVGFRLFTKATDPNLREIKLVYNDPTNGEKLLYRYYVTNGGSVPYSTLMYNNPWAFALPLVYSDYFAYGDYADISNVASNKTVEVLLLPRDDKDEATHRVLFVNSSNHHLLAVETVSNGGDVIDPVFTKTVPEDTRTKHYYFNWAGYNGNQDVDYEYDFDNSTVKNVTKTLILTTSYKTANLRVEPIFYSKTFQKGAGFFTYYFSMDSYTAMMPYADNVKELFDVYLTEGSFMTTSSDYDRSNRINPVYHNENGSSGVFDGLTGIKYTLHIDFRYNLSYTGEEIHNKSYRMSFALTPSNSYDTLTVTAPYYNTITVKKTNTSKDYGYKVLPKNLTYEDYLGYNYSFEKEYSFSRLQVNTDYQVYTLKKENFWIINQQKDNEPSETQYSNNQLIINIATVPYDVSTPYDDEPTDFTLKIKAKVVNKSWGSYYEAINQPSGVDDRIQLHIGSYSVQKDIGPIDVNFTIVFTSYNYDYTHGYERNEMNYTMTFKYNAEKGYYIPEYGSSMIYKYLFGVEDRQIDPWDNNSYLQGIFQVERAEVQYYYNSYETEYLYPHLYYGVGHSEPNVEVIVVS